MYSHIFKLWSCIVLLQLTFSTLPLFITVFPFYVQLQLLSE